MDEKDLINASDSSLLGYESSFKPLQSFVE